jgi:hypothetical protein
MLAHEYSACQDKVEVNLEVIGGAGVRMGKGKPEPRRQNVEIEEIAIGS